MIVSEKKHLVVGVCGPPGAGKTTLVRSVAKTIKHSKVVFYDDHQTVTRQSQAFIDEWLARGADPNEFALTELVAALSRAADELAASGQQGVVFFETPFGRRHRDTAKFIDLLFWIEVPLDVAFARQVRSFCHAALTRPRSSDGDFIRWLEAYSAIYLSSIRSAYQKQAHEVASGADRTLDGTRDITALGDEVAALVLKRLGVSGAPEA